MTQWNSLLEKQDYLSIKKYIKSGGNTNENSDESGESVLAMALRKRCSYDIIELLVQNEANVHSVDHEGVSVFDNAITYNHQEFVEWLVNNGTDVNNCQRKSNFTPLMAAVCYGRRAMVELFIKKGADINTMDTKGFTPKEFARRMNKKSILKILEEYEAK
jgi:ankyrin repeat protein